MEYPSPGEHANRNAIIFALSGLTLIVLVVASIASPAPTHRSEFPFVPTKEPLTSEQLRAAIADYCGFTGVKQLDLNAPEGLGLTVSKWETWYFTPLEDETPNDSYEAALCQVGFSTVIVRDPEGPEGDWDVGFNPEVGVNIAVNGHFWWVEDPGSDNVYYQGNAAKLFLRGQGLAWLIDFGLQDQTSILRFGIDRLTGEIVPLP